MLVADKAYVMKSNIHYQTHGAKFEIIMAAPSYRVLISAQQASAKVFQSGRGSMKAELVYAMLKQAWYWQTKQLAYHRRRPFRAKLGLFFVVLDCTLAVGPVVYSMGLGLGQNSVPGDVRN